MSKEKNREKMQILYHDIQSVGRLKIIKNKIFDYYEYNEYLKKVCEYNIRSILEKYYSREELTREEEESIGKYLFFSSRFYAGSADGPDLYDLRLQSCFGSGNFDSEELESIYKINKQRKQSSKKR